ncbi:MAG: hypothetical protein R6V54_12475 [Desulfobacteraceae bacterium]
MLSSFIHKSPITAMVFATLLSLTLFPSPGHPSDLTTPPLNQTDSNDPAQKEWFKALSSKLVKEKRILAWCDDVSLQQKRHFEFNGMDYQLYNKEFRHTSYLEPKMMERAFAKTAEHLVLTTRAGEKLNRFAEKIASFFQVSYVKLSDSQEGILNLPGEKPGLRGKEKKKIFELSFSTRIFSTAEADPMKWTWDAAASFHDFRADTSYEPTANELTLEFSNSRLNGYLNGSAEIEVSQDPWETKYAVSFSIDF